MISRRVMLALAAAAPASVAIAGPPKAALPQVVTGTVNYGADRRLWTPVSIGGKGPYRFVIDTGAQVSCISESVGKQLGLKSLRQIEVTGVSGKDEVDMFLATDVIIGGAFRQKEMALLGLNSMGRDDGLLAAGVLTYFDSAIDVAAGRFHIYPQGQTDRAGFTRIPGRWSKSDDGVSRILLLDTTIDGRRLQLMVDTGASSGIFIGPRYMQRNRALWTSKTDYKPRAIRGVTGSLMGHDVRAEVKLGGLSFSDEVITLADPAAYQQGGHDGLIGMEFLERYVFAFEAAKAALWLKPNNGAD